MILDNLELVTSPHPAQAPILALPLAQWLRTIVPVWPLTAVMSLADWLCSRREMEVVWAIYRKWELVIIKFIGWCHGQCLSVAWWERVHDVWQCTDLHCSAYSSVSVYWSNVGRIEVFDLLSTFKIMPVLLPGLTHQRVYPQQCSHTLPTHSVGTQYQQYMLQETVL